MTTLPTLCIKGKLDLTRVVLLHAAADTNGTANTFESGYSIWNFPKFDLIWFDTINFIFEVRNLSDFKWSLLKQSVYYRLLTKLPSGYAWSKVPSRGGGGMSMGVGMSREWVGPTQTWDLVQPPKYWHLAVATDVGDTHPTEMYSSFKESFLRQNLAW